MNSQQLKRGAFLTFKRARQRLQGGGLPTRNVIFVAGHQRSGTNMLMNVLEKSWQTDVYHERDSRAFEDYQMRERRVIHRLREQSPASHFAIKALCELQDLPSLMAEFEPARVIWIYRHYHDVVNSMLRSFTGFSGQFRAIALDRDSAGWRGRGMSDATHALIASIGQKDIGEASAAAMQWYYRNMLYFERALDSNPQVMLVRYEDLVTRPNEEFGRIFEFLGLEFTGRVARKVFASSIRRNAHPELDVKVETVCSELYDRFQALAVHPA